MIAMGGRHSQDRLSSRFALHIRRYWPYYIMILPGLIFLILVKYVPMAGSVIVFQNFSLRKGVFGSP